MHIPANKQSWSGRIDDPLDPETFRWFQQIDIFPEEPSMAMENDLLKIALCGYASDQGTIQNAGRAGAAEGPGMVRRYLGSLPWLPGIHVADMGDWKSDGVHVGLLQVELARSVTDFKNQDYFTIILGGSHDLSYGHYLGLHQFYKMRFPDCKIGVINFDAHLDIRPYPMGPHSGSSFSQIADLLLSNGEPFLYCCLGVQRQSNTRALYRKAEEFNVDIVEASKIDLRNMEWLKDHLLEFIDRVDFFLLSIDLDVFATAHAPGVSAPSPLGIDPVIVREILPLIIGSGKILGCDFAEINPTYDFDNRTSRLTSWLIYDIVDILSKVKRW